MMSGAALASVAPALALAVVAALPAVAPRGFWAVSQEMGADFAMGLIACRKLVSRAALRQQRPLPRITFCGM